MELNTIVKGENIIDGVMPGSIAEELEIERNKFSEYYLLSPSNN